MAELYRGTNYKVTTRFLRLGYQVTNLATGVVEYKNSSLPRCIIMAEECDEFFSRRELATKEVTNARVLAFPSKDNPK